MTAAILGAGGAHNPQAEQMAGESMRRTLAAQAAAIWPQERGLFRRYALPQRARIADVGTGTDAKIGRRTLPLLQKLGLVDLSVDYVVVDTQRVPRATFAAILTAWRDGFAATIADHSGLARAETRALFRRDRHRYPRSGPVRRMAGADRERPASGLSDAENVSRPVPVG